MKTSVAVEPKWLSRKDAVAAYAIGLTTLDELIASGEVLARKNGRRTLVNVASLSAWVEGLPEA